MNLKAKIILGYCSVILVTLVLSVVAFHSHIRVTGLYEEVTTKDLQVAKVANELTYRMTQRMAGLQGFLLTGRTRYLVAYDENILPIKTLIEKAEDLSGENRGYYALIGEYGKLVNEWQERIAETEKAMRLQLDYGDISYQKYVTSVSEIDRSGRSIIRQMRDTENQLVQEVEAAARAKLLAATQLGKSTRNWLAVMAITGIVVSLFFSVVLSTRVTSGLSIVAHAARTISAGDLSCRVPPAKNKDELSLLGSTFNQMAEQLEVNIRVLKESEQKYSTLVEEANDGIIIIQDERYVFANRTFSNIMGYSVEEITGIGYLDIVAAESRDSLKERYQKRLTGDTVSSVTEARFVTKGGDERYLEINAATIEFRDRQAVLVIMRDVTDRKQTEEVLKRLSDQVITAQEEERKRISRELHDEIGQALMAIEINIEILDQGARLTADTRRRRIDDTKKLIEKTIDDIHRISYDLRPHLLDNLGLVPAVQSYVDTFTERTGIAAVFTTTDDALHLAPSLETLIYRVIQESLTNISKHADARKASVSIHCTAEAVEVLVEDDGRGFVTDSVSRRPDPGVKGLGLFGMRERVEMAGGSFCISSEPERGTRVSVSLPYREDSHEQT